MKSTQTSQFDYLFDFQNQDKSEELKRLDRTAYAVFGGGLLLSLGMLAAIVSAKLIIGA